MKPKIIKSEALAALQTNKEMLAKIDAAYSDEPDATEQALRRKSRQQHRRIVEGEKQ